MKAVWKLTLISIFVICTSNSWASNNSLSFGVQIVQLSKEQSSSERTKAYQDFTNYLSQEMHQPVKLVVFDKNKDLINALDKGTITAAYVKSGAYAIAKLENKDITYLLTGLTRGHAAKKNITSASYLVSLPSSQIKNLQQLKGKRIGFVHDSANGFIYPVAYLNKQGIDYKTYFSSYRFYPSLYEVLMGLKKHEIDAGAIWDAHYEMNKNSLPLNIIAKIPGVPNAVIAVSKSLSATQKEQLKQALIKLPPDAFKNLFFVGFKETNPSLYDPLISFTKAALNL